MQAFSNMTVAMRRELCAVMEYKVIEKAGSVLYNDGDVVGAWTAILNGSVEIVHPDGRTEEHRDRCCIIKSKLFMTAAYDTSENICM